MKKQPDNVCILCVLCSDSVFPKGCALTIWTFLFGSVKIIKILSKTVFQ